MGIISRIQIILFSIIVGIIILLSFFLISPLVKSISETVSSIYSIYTGNNRKILQELEQENKKLLRNKKNVEKLSSADNSSAKWYEFLQNNLKEYKIETSRINSTGIRNMGKFSVEDFSFRCKSKYHTIGLFISKIENSEFVCSIKNVHLISKSLLSNNIDVVITISFYMK